MIIYDEERKALPDEQLFRLFRAVGWADEDCPDELRRSFSAPFRHSTLVISAWAGERLVGAVRVLSDTCVRAVVYDLAVEPAWQGRGIGSELLRRCRAHYPGAEWLVQTTRATAPFYEKNGFTPLTEDAFLRIHSRYF
ncbi:MAG: GNAT family N-acetyltransferase [Aristaeellaceae bacterium]